MNIAKLKEVNSRSIWILQSCKHLHFYKLHLTLTVGPTQASCDFAPFPSVYAVEAHALHNTAPFSSLYFVDGKIYVIQQN